MSTSRSILPCSGLYCGTSRRYHVSVRNPNRLSISSKSKINNCLLGNGHESLQFLSSGLKELILSKPLWDMAANSSAQAGPPLPPDPSPGSWKLWIAGLIAPMILPLLTNRLGPLLKLKREVETVVDTAEAVTEAIEKVAEEMDRVAEEVADHLPAGGKLKQVATLIEHIAEETAKDAQMAEDAMEKVEEVEKKLDSFIQPLINQVPTMPKEANDQKLS